MTDLDPISQIRITLWQYQNDLRYGVNDEGSRERRLEAIDRALELLDGIEVEKAA